MTVERDTASFPLAPSPWLNIGMKNDEAERHTKPTADPQAVERARLLRLAKARGLDMSPPQWQRFWRSAEDQAWLDVPSVGREKLD